MWHSCKMLRNVAAGQVGVINDAVTRFEQRCHTDCDTPRLKSQMADDTSKNIQTLIDSQLCEGK